VFHTHPIQYFAPIWRGLARERDLSVRVHFFSDHSVRGGLDRDFGVNVAWDVPILEGYDSRFLSRDADIYRPGSVGISEPSRLLREGGFDSVLVNGYAYAFERQIVRAARKLGLRILFRGEVTDDPRETARGALRSPLRGLYLRWFYAHVDAFCYIGKRAREHFLGLGVEESRLFFSPYSVDSSLFRAQRAEWDRERARRELGIPVDARVILFSGKLIPRKAPLLLLEAARSLRHLERTWLLVVGDGELREPVAALGNEVLGERFLAPGFVNQSRLGAYFGAADVFVLPSRFETWGLVVNEAMEFGLPVVVGSKVGCHPDLVVPGATGLVFPDGDRNALARALEEILSEPRRAAEMGIAAQEHVGKYGTDFAVRGILSALGREA
jgi:glycosyltransferase involved in cell wall biosynthesis